MRNTKKTFNATAPTRLRGGLHASPSHLLMLVASAAFLLSLLSIHFARPAAAATRDDASAAFDRTWERTDYPVANMLVARTWIWGPQPLFVPFKEPYTDAQGGERWVLYYDKARMEFPDANADPDSTWSVTNGLIARELITGQMQTGDTHFEQHSPSTQNVAGDAHDPQAPAYASFTDLLDIPPHEDFASITERLLRDGSVQVDATLARFGAVYGMRVQAGDVQRQIASPFWEFMTSSGPVYEHGVLSDALLFKDPVYATGYPITEPYWTRVNVAGEKQDVLVQCFERRCLTWTPTNPDGFRTESSNVGQHYAAWRYPTPPAPTPTPTTPTAVPTTCVASGQSSIRVKNGDELRDAIASARPGDSILLADGVYTGQFQIHRSGTASAPILLCGGRAAELRGDTVQSGYGILLEADYWHIEGVTITRFLKGIEAHGTTGSVLRGMAIRNIGQEGIHLRDGSTHTVVDWNVITDTGRYRPGWGEGIYIGSDSSQWCDAQGQQGGCATDASDGNLIQFNTIGPGITAELIDIKEGTSRGVVRSNTLRGDAKHDGSIDALISIKGNDWLIIGNEGNHAPEHGMRVNTDDLPGWGTGNVFVDNTLDVGADGFGFRMPLGADGVPLGNVVSCANTVTNAAAGFANVPCTVDIVLP